MTYCTSDNSFLTNLENPIRSLVKLLRDNGFNTFTSCGHDMWVAMHWEQWVAPADGFIEKLKRLLYGNGYKEFRVFTEIICGNEQKWHEKANVVVCLPLKDGHYSIKVFGKFDFTVENHEQPESQASSSKKD